MTGMSLIRSFAGHPAKNVLEACAILSSAQTKLISLMTDVEAHFKVQG
jgi:hypothetical protein